MRVSRLDIISCGNDDFPREYNGTVRIMGMGKQAKILNENQLQALLA